MLNYIELLQQFVTTDYKLRYKNSALGILWLVLKPLAMFSIMYVVWSNFVRNDPSYKMNLLLGIMIMYFLNDGIVMGLNSLLSKAHIILKINFPREVVVFSSTATSVINFLINMLVFGVFAVFSQTDITFAGFILFFIAVLTVYLLIVGISMFLSIMYVKLRDIHQIVELVLQVLMWGTPIFYKLDMLPEQYQKIILLNPLTHLIGYARKGLLDGSNVNINDFGGALLFLLMGSILALLGYMYFKSRVLKIAEYF